MNRKLKAALITAIIIIALASVLLPIMSAFLAVVMSPVGVIAFVLITVLGCYGLFRLVLKLLP